MGKKDEPAMWFDFVVEDDLGLMVILTGLNERSKKTRILPLLVRLLWPFRLCSEVREFLLYIDDAAFVKNQGGEKKIDSCDSHLYCLSDCLDSNSSRIFVPRFIPNCHMLAYLTTKSGNFKKNI